MSGNVCEWYSGGRCRSGVSWNGLLCDCVWCDDGGPGMTWKLAELAEGMYAWWCSEPTICLWQHHWMDRDMFFEKSQKKRKVVLLRKLKIEGELLVLGFKLSKSLLCLALGGIFGTSLRTELKLSRNCLNLMRNVRRWRFTGHGGPVGKEKGKEVPWSLVLKSEGVFSSSPHLLLTAVLGSCHTFFFLQFHIALKRAVSQY